MQHTPLTPRGLERRIKRHLMLGTRDEPRSRGGLIRVREFTMKDAYSFHTGMDDLQRYYERCAEAYRRLFLLFDQCDYRDEYGDR